MSELHIDQLGQVVELKSSPPEAGGFRIGSCQMCVYTDMNEEGKGLSCSNFEPVGQNCIRETRGYWVLAEVSDE